MCINPHHDTRLRRTAVAGACTALQRGAVNTLGQTVMHRLVHMPSIQSCRRPINVLFPIKRCVLVNYVFEVLGLINKFERDIHSTGACHAHIDGRRLNQNNVQHVALRGPYVVAAKLCAAFSHAQYTKRNRSVSEEATTHITYVLHHMQSAFNTYYTS